MNIASIEDLLAVLVCECFLGQMDIKGLLHCVCVYEYVCICMSFMMLSLLYLSLLSMCVCVCTSWVK